MRKQCKGTLILVVLWLIFVILVFFRSDVHEKLGSYTQLHHHNNQNDYGQDETSMISRRPMRAFVCITGQLSRLKLENKVDNLLNHWHYKYGVEIDVALAISNTTFASKPHFETLRTSGSVPDFSDMDQVRQYFESLLPSGVKLLNSELYEPTLDPAVNQQYYRQRSIGSTKKSEQSKLQRVQNHIRQFESLSRCYTQLKLSNEDYDIVHRVRDDSGYPYPVNFSKLVRMTREFPKTIVSSACQTHSGVNDRGSFVSLDAAYDYFNHPIQYMYTKQQFPTDVFNTEEFLLWAYSQTCTMVTTHDFDILKISLNSHSKATILNEFLSESSGDYLANCIEEGRSNNSTRFPVKLEKCRTFSTGHNACINYR